MKLSSLILILLFLALLPAQLCAKEIAYIDITSPNSRRINIAVPWFINIEQPTRLQPLGRDLASTLGKSLDFHGIFSLIPSEHYGNDQNANWKTLGADFVVLGNQWLQSPGSPSADIFIDTKVDFKDMEMLSEQWLAGSCQ